MSGYWDYTTGTWKTGATPIGPGSSGFGGGVTFPVGGSGGVTDTGVTDTGGGSSSGGINWGTFAKLLEAGVSIASALLGSSNQSKANSINQGLLDQLAAQRQMGIGLGKIGAVGNPFSGQYGSVFGAAPGATSAPSGKKVPATAVPPVASAGGLALPLIRNPTGLTL